jgi:hypothetical protein
MPRELWRYRVSLRNVADLTGNGVLAEFGLPDAIPGQITVSTEPGELRLRRGITASGKQEQAWRDIQRSARWASGSVAGVGRSGGPLV